MTRSAAWMALVLAAGQVVAADAPPPPQPSAQGSAGAARPKAEGRLSVRDFGAKGDGVADDYDAIQAAVAAVNAQGGGTLVFPKGVYRVGRHRIDGGPAANGVTNFRFERCRGLTIEGQGSKIDLDGDWVRTADYTDRFTRSYHNAVGFSFSQVEGLAILDLEIDGNADQTTKEAAAEGTSHGISLEGCRDVTLDGVWVHHMQSDGLIVTLAWDPPGQKKRYKVTRDLRVANSRFTHNARQGVSFVQGRHATFLNCDFSHTGQTGKYGGHSPMAGVDVEPDRWPGAPQGWEGDDFTGDVVFSGCRFEENGGFEYVGTNERTAPHPITFIGCRFADAIGAFRPAVSPGSAATRFLGCTFENVQVIPFIGATAAPTSSVEIGWSRFTSADPRQRVLTLGRNQGRLSVHDSEFRFAAVGTPGPAYRFYVQAGGLGEFVDNLVWIDGREHLGTPRDVKFLLQGLERVEGNRWRTDLARPGAAFGIALDGTAEVGRGDLVQEGRFQSFPPRRAERKP